MCSSDLTDRLRARVREPFDKIEAGTTSLARLQETADILRRVIRILQLSKRLAASMAAGETDVGKAAQGLAELSDLLQEDLTGLEVVEGEARRARQWRAEVERQGEQLLARGLETGNQASTGTGLQVFYNLGSLSAVVAGLLDSLHSEVRHAWTEGLDIKRISERGEQGGEARGRTPGRANLPSGNMAAFRATLWSNLDSLLEGLHAHVVKVYHLQRLLCKKVDPLTHQTYISVLDQPALVSASWSRLTDIVRTSLADAVIKSNFVKQTLEAYVEKKLDLQTILQDLKDPVEFLRMIRKKQNQVDVIKKPTSIVMCQECEKKAAVVRCEQCKDYFCQDCFNSTHATGKRRAHITSDVEQLVCAAYEDRVATCQCVQCGLFYSDEGFLYDYSKHGEDWAMGQ